ncbi:MAG: transporter [Dehalococcoidia bacterium]|nr:transporter [Dehalococcoidia bacterium]
MLSDHYGRKAVIVPGILLDAASLVMFSFSRGFGAFVGAGVLMGLGSGLANPITTAYGADMARRSNIGITMGLLRTFGDIGYFVGPVLLGWIADRSGNESALLVNAGLLILVMVLLAVAAKETVTRRQGSRGSV